MNDDHPLLPRPLPSLSDEAAVEILDFLHDFIDAFEAAYRDQVRRHYRDLRSSRLADPANTATTGNNDPPF